jgi:hypothetical protein
MSDVIYGNWAATWSDTAHPGLNRQHQFRVPFQKIRVGMDVNAHTAVSLDKTVQNTVVFGDAQTVTARIRAEQNTQSLSDLISAGLQGVAITLVDLDQTDRSVAVYMEDPAGTWVALHDMSGTPWEYEAEVRFRRTDGSRFPDWFLYQTHGTDGLLYKYVPGMDLSAATFTRATTATYVDIDGVTQTDGAAVNEVRDGHYQTVDSVWTRTLRLESAESETLEVPWPHEPQAASVYVKFVERGGAGTSLGVLVAFGMETTDSGSPRWIIVGNGTSKYQIYHQNGTATSTATAVDTVSSGDVVEIVGQLKADGSVTILQSVDGAAVSSNSDATTATLQAAWNGEGLMIGTQPADLADGDCDIERIVVAAGVQTMDHMRSL